MVLHLFAAALLPLGEGRRVAQLLPRQWRHHTTEATPWARRADAAPHVRGAEDPVRLVTVLELSTEAIDLGLTVPQSFLLLLNAALLLHEIAHVFWAAFPGSEALGQLVVLLLEHRLLRTRQAARGLKGSRQSTLLHGAGFPSLTHRLLLDLLPRGLRPRNLLLCFAELTAQLLALNLGLGILLGQARLEALAAGTQAGLEVFVQLVFRSRMLRLQGPLLVDPARRLRGNKPLQGRHLRGPGLSCSAHSRLTLPADLGRLALQALGLGSVSLPANFQLLLEAGLELRLPVLSLGTQSPERGLGFVQRQGAEAQLLHRGRQLRLQRCTARSGRLTLFPECIGLGCGRTQSLGG
mmetsp:Transcript_79192/g.169629  ORF Transcript_79192/g.169629 Transcript_79192/m.169629 type:complete len:352 (-) Transcript_79192:1882-2937(-)